MKQELGFTLKLSKITNRNRNDLKTKIIEYFDIDEHICRVQFEEFSTKNKERWDLTMPQIIVSMSLRTITKLQQLLLELHVDTNTIKLLSENQNDQNDQILNTENCNQIETDKEKNHGFVDVFDPSKCCICFDNPTEEVLECNHSFCSSCLRGW